MTNKEIVLMAMHNQGKIAAIDLRSRAINMDGTQIIAEEIKTPLFDPNKDYSAWPVGSPVRELVDGEYQVFTLLQPHNAAYYPGSTPAKERALWSLCHTKDPEKAKPYVAPLGISGLYKLDEVCTKDGFVWISKIDNNSYVPNTLGTETLWEKIK